jgi:hypothetical protein
MLAQIVVVDDDPLDAVSSRVTAGVATPADAGSAAPDSRATIGP